MDPEAYSDGWEAALEAVSRLNPGVALPLSPRQRRASEKAWDDRVTVPPRKS